MKPDFLYFEGDDSYGHVVDAMNHGYHKISKINDKQFQCEDCNQVYSAALVEICIKTEPRSIIPRPMYAMPYTMGD